MFWISEASHCFCFFLLQAHRAYTVEKGRPLGRGLGNGRRKDEERLQMGICDMLTEGGLRASL